jgi:hypothetical protein
MSDFIDNDGQPIFAETFDHRQVPFENIMIDVIETNGNLWFNGADVLPAMGFQPHHKGGFGRMLQRIDHPDIIKITDTGFRSTDGRRNRGFLISPRAVVQFADGKTQGRNPIKINNFITWMEEHVLIGGRDAKAWSPAKKAAVTLEPVFHRIVRVIDQDEHGRDLDPLRPRRLYRTATLESPIGPDEIEFCLCGGSWEGLGKCWCGGKGRLRVAIPAPFIPYDGDDVLDLDDDLTEPRWTPATRNRPARSLYPSRV